MNKKIIITVIFSVLPLGCLDGGSRAAKPQFRTDHQPLLKRFPFLGVFKARSDWR